MRQRIISGAIGICLFITVLFFRDTPLFNLVISLLSVLALWEIFAATGYIKNKLLLILCEIFAAIVPFFRGPYFNLSSRTACLLFILCLFALMLFDHNKIRLEQVGLCFMMSVIIPFAFSTLVYLRDMYKEVGRHNLQYMDGLFFIILATAGAWVPDIGAYFIGRVLGRHKLAPNISPKKTVEGAVGGLLCNVVFFILYGLLYQAVVRGQILRWLDLEDHYYPTAHVSILALALISIACTAASILGDLSASFIKRSCNIKDFGNILPGHGGVLDRFDSFLLVAPLTYVIACYVPIIIR